MPDAPLTQLPDEIRTSGASRRLLRWCMDTLRAHRVIEAGYEARHLMAHALGVRPSLVTLRNLTLDPAQMTACVELIERRIAGEPFQYLIGETGFRRGLFTCRPGVLIPRPESETLVERVIIHLLMQPEVHRRLLDLGTGSGALIISLAMDYPKHTYVATDLSGEALGLAEENAQRNGVGNRIAFLRGDWWEALRTHRVALPFDLILSNPPYIPTGELGNLPVEIREHEPLTALDGGRDGLAFYRRLIGELRTFLKPGGWLVVEVGDGQAGLVQQLFEHAGLREITVTFDLHNLPRVVEGRLPTIEEAQFSEEAEAIDD